LRMVLANKPRTVVPFQRSGSAQYANESHRRLRNHVDHQMPDQPAPEIKQELIDVVDIGIKVAELASHAGYRRDRTEYVDEPTELERHDFAARAGLPLGDIEILVAFPGMPIRQVLSAMIGEGERASDRFVSDEPLDAPGPEIVPHRAGGRSDDPRLL